MPETFTTTLPTYVQMSRALLRMANEGALATRLVVKLTRQDIHHLFPSFGKRFPLEHHIPMQDGTVRTIDCRRHEHPWVIDLLTEKDHQRLAEEAAKLQVVRNAIDRKIQGAQSESPLSPAAPRDAHAPIH